MKNVNAGILKIKGMILYPCCKSEKIVVYEGSSGKCSIKCPRCGHYAVFDYDNMDSNPGQTLRGIAHELNK